MRPDAASYLERDADRALVTALIRGELCYILDSRQKGKSSLIVRSLDRLRNEGIAVAKIDLQHHGSNLQSDQWYGGMLHTIGNDLGITSLLFDYWRSHLDEGPMARWFGALEHVALKLIDRPIVIFIDEIDFLLSLPFPTDEFFAGIRECYNRRATKPEFEHLTFCLSGVATPTQLIANEDVTPFNVGTRIVLTDFTRAELQPYVDLFESRESGGNSVIDRIYWWTSGHPYLTQLLAAACVADTTVEKPADVDGIVDRILLEPEARQRETNLADAQRRLLETTPSGVTPEESRSRILEVYRLVLRGEPLAAGQDPNVVATLLLSGVVVERQAKLCIRNRLYATLFDETWRRNNLPILENERQRAAFLRAAWRVGSISLAVIISMTLMVTYLIAVTRQRNQALASARKLNAQMRHITYETSIALAGVRVEDANYLRSRELIRSQQNSTERGWEWYLLRALFDEAKVIRPPDPDPQHAHRSFSAWMEGNAMITVENDIVRREGVEVGNLRRFKSFENGALRLKWLRSTAAQGDIEHRILVADRVFGSSDKALVALSESATNEAICDSAKHAIELVNLVTGAHERVTTDFSPSSCYFSHTGRFLIAQTADGFSSLYDLSAKRWLWGRVLSQNGHPDFSPDDSHLILLQFSPDMGILRTIDATVSAQLRGNLGQILDTAWSKDGKQLVTSSSDGTVRVWDTASGEQMRVFLGAPSAVDQVSLSGDSRTILGVTMQSSILTWSLTSQPLYERLDLHTGKITAMKLSPDGHRCVTSAINGVSSLVDTDTARIIARIDLGKTTAVHATAFSPDSRLLAASATNGSVVLINARDGSVVRRVHLSDALAPSIAISPSGSIFVALTRGGFVSFSGVAANPIHHQAPGFEVNRIACSSDGKVVAVSSPTGEIATCDTVTFKFELLRKRSSRLVSVEFSPDGKWLSAASADFNAYLFPLHAGEKAQILAGHEGRVWSAHFSPDSKRVVTNAYDNTARVWDVESGKIVSLMQHGSWVSSAQWSPDGRRIVTASADNYARIFDPVDGFELLKLQGHHDIVFDALLTPDNKTLITDCGDGSLRFWRTDKNSS